MTLFLLGLLGAAGLLKGRGASVGGGFWASLPERLHSETAQRAIMDAILDRGEFDWRLISEERTLPDGSTVTVTLPVTNAVKVDGVRVSNLLYPNAQRLADKMGLLLPTSLIADMVHRSAVVRFAPQSEPMQTYVDAGTNTTKSSTLEHSRLVDEAVAGRTGLTDNEGKWFVLAKRLWQPPRGSGIYGWWRKNGELIQKNVTAHPELAFADYSQVLRFVGAWTTIQASDQPSFNMPTAAVYTSSDWAWLLSGDGPLPGSRHPAVLEVA